MARWHDREGRADDPLLDEFRDWFTAEECFRHLDDGVPDQGLVNRLLKRLSDGKLAAAGVEARWKEDGQTKVRFAPTTIDPRWWLNAQDVQNPYCDLWRTGEFSCLIVYGDGVIGGEVLVNFYGVRFEYGEMLDAVPGLKAHNPRIPMLGGGRFEAGEPQLPRFLKSKEPQKSGTPEPLRHSKLMEDPRLPALEAEVAKLKAALLAADRPSAPSPVRALIDLDSLPNKGGRPRAEFWDDMLLAIVKSIYDGEFKPKNQAEVTRAMQDWVADHGYNGGLTQIKAVAAKAFKLFQ